MNSVFRIIACCSVATTLAHAQFQDVFLIGTDNGSGLEFEVQTASLVDYYWENDNYTALPGLNWTSDMEPWDNAIAGDALGFPRALTQPGGVNTQTNIFFHLDANEAKPGQPMRLTVDLINPQVGTTHDLDVRLNGAAPFASRTLINSAQSWVVNTTAGAMGAVAGPNVLRVRRTGGTVSAATIQFDHVRLEADISPQYINTFTTSKSLLRPGETAALTWVLYEPAATVSIDQGIGDVTALTTGGTGSVNVTPAVNTIYTLSATFGGSTQTVQVTVNTSPWYALFEAGTDNASAAEFSHELAADDDYYFAGNYTSVGGPNQAANEVMNDDVNTDTVAGRTGNPAIGFERAVTGSDPHQNIWFVPPPASVAPTARIRITADVLSATGTGSPNTHTLEFSMNGNVIRSENNITGARLVQFETTGISAGFVTGPNKLTIRRTAGVLAGIVTFDYVMVEYLPGTAPAISAITDDIILGTHTVNWTSAVGRTYRVQKSADAGTTWIDLALGFPTGGALGTTMFYEDRVTPWTDPRPEYRVLLE